MAEPLLEIKGLTKAFPGVQALSGVDFTLLPGEVHALVGENGAGKSTLVKIITGAQKPDAGTIRFEGRDLGGLDIATAIALGISVIYQELNLFPNLSVAENIFFGREPRRGAFVDMKRMHADAEGLFDRMGYRLDTRAKVGSFGAAYQQLVEIAIAVSRKAKLLIMDEPTAPLSSDEVGKLFELIRRLKAEGVSVIYISHRLEELDQICDRVTVLRDGQKVAELPLAEVSRERLISLMVGRPLTQQYPAKLPVPKDAPVLLSAEGIRAPRVKGCSFGLRRGEILGIGGLVGAGRTELVRAAFGIDRRQGGRVSLDGRVLRVGDPGRSISEGIVLIPEERKAQGILPNMSVADNMLFPGLRSYRLGPFLNGRRMRKAVGTMVDNLSIKTPTQEQRIVHLSGGNQQKVIIARWMLMDAEILVFDEPTRGIDVGARYEIYQLMNGLKASGKSLIVISSDMQELIGVSDRVLVMCDGLFTGSLSGDEITQENILRLAADFSPAGQSGATTSSDDREVPA
jgi:ribose transport system ATP-binding protein